MDVVEIIYQLAVGGFLGFLLCAILFLISAIFYAIRGGE